MRRYVAIVLILCGTVLALAPAASDYWQERELAQLELRQDLIGTHTFIRQPLEQEYRLGAWLLGAGMIGLGIMSGWQRAGLERIRTTRVESDSSLTRAAG